MLDSTTPDPIRQLLDAWDIEPYRSDRELYLASPGRDEPLTDVEWLEGEALRYGGEGSDVARLAADALMGLAAGMADAGHFDAGGYRSALARGSN